LPCSAHKDQYGTSYLIPAAPASKTADGRTLRGCPAVDVWWSRRDSKATAEETMVIRQEYEDRSTADVLELTQGQVYDLIDALNKAMEAA
jgi:hypothetical protein